METIPLEIAIERIKKDKAEEINLSGKDMGDEGVRRLFEAFGEKNKNLKRLYLIGNEISDKGSIFVAQMLEKCEKIEEIYLGVNDISDKGLINIAETVEKNPTLKKLDLYLNRSIGDKGAIRMAEALERNTALRTLGLSNCGITERGGERFIRALSINTTLNQLSLHWNEGMKKETWERIMVISQSRRIHKLIPAVKRMEESQPPKPTERNEDMMMKLIAKDAEIREYKRVIEENMALIEEQRRLTRRKDALIEEKDKKIKDFEMRHLMNVSLIEELENASVPVVPSVSLSFCASCQGYFNTQKIADETKEQQLLEESVIPRNPLHFDRIIDPSSCVLCLYQHVRVRIRALNREERWNGIHKWFISSHRHPFIPRLLGVVKKEKIHLIKGIEPLLPSLSGKNVDGIAVIDASTVGKFTLHELLHSHGQDGEGDDGSDGCHLVDEEGKFFDVTDKSVILTVLIDIGSVLAFLHNELGIVHGSINSHSIAIRYSMEEGRFTAQLSDVGLWNREMLKDDRIRWVAPELIASDGSTEPSYESDVWSFGMLVEEMMTRELPNIDSLPIMTDFGRGGGGGGYVDLVEQCRLHVPKERPPITSVLETLKRMRN